MEAYLMTLVNMVVGALTILLIANALISFAPLEPWHPVRRFLNQLAEPILRPFRNILPPAGNLDLSPMVAIIAIQILGQLTMVLIQAAF
ncbi:MAG: YggT family protein [Anaerolineales bacterium]|nr:YggT family protein [Anaerolineales bacterium]